MLSKNYNPNKYNSTNAKYIQFHDGKKIPRMKHTTKHKLQNNSKKSSKKFLRNTIILTTVTGLVFAPFVVSCDYNAPVKQIEVEDKIEEYIEKYPTIKVTVQERESISDYWGRGIRFSDITLPEFEDAIRRLNFKSKTNDYSSTGILNPGDEVIILDTTKLKEDTIDNKLEE